MAEALASRFARIPQGGSRFDRLECGGECTDVYKQRDAPAPYSGIRPREASLIALAAAAGRERGQRGAAAL